MQHKFKKSCLLGVGLLGLAIAPLATQAAELTANAGITSNYVFRGETQTDDGIAVQGGVDYVHEVGVYAGAWASNVELSNGSGDKGYEADLYVGYNFKLNEDVLFDVGYIAYQYTSIARNDAAEIYFGASFKDVSVTYYDGDEDNSTDYSYIDLKYSMALPSDFNLHLHYGNLDRSGADAQDVAVGVSKNIEGFDVGLTITTIDHDNAATQDDDEVFITVSKAFQLM